MQHLVDFVETACQYYCDTPEAAQTYAIQHGVDAHLPDIRCVFNAELRRMTVRHDRYRRKHCHTIAF